MMFVPGGRVQQVAPSRPLKQPFGGTRRGAPEEIPDLCPQRQPQNTADARQSSEGIIRRYTFRGL